MTRKKRDGLKPVATRLMPSARLGKNLTER